jgi:hypothetical protein
MLKKALPAPGRFTGMAASLEEEEGSLLMKISFTEGMPLFLI